MPDKTVKIGNSGKEFVRNLSSDTNTSLLEAGGSLVKKGLEYKRKGEPSIKGPFGIDRPFSKIELPGPKQQLMVRVDDAQIEDARDVFNQHTDAAALQDAIRLGIYSESPDTVRIEGPGGVVRPFAGDDNA